MIKGYFHVAIMGIKSKEIVVEMLNDIQNSGLLDATDELHICVVGGKVKINHPKIFVHILPNPLSDFEYPTMEMMQLECRKNPEMIVYYLHTKGASSPLDESRIQWRRDMIKCVVNNYKLCIEKLTEYETVGTRLLMEKGGQYPRHYSGNFRWARASYINKLPDIRLKKRESRYYAEFRLLGEYKDALYYNME